jgi:hypothetical protein
MEITVEPTLASILTIAGAAVAATLVTTFVELAKKTLPIIGARDWEQALALAVAGALVVVASVDRHQAAGVTTLNDGFVSVVAWLMIGKLSTGIYDEATRRVGSIAGPAPAPAPAVPVPGEVGP